MEKIDIVIPWVDGEDPIWQQEKAKYSSTDPQGNESYRFRDWDLLHFFFRGIEKYAPWINQIHFITCGHLPRWLNTNHPKLHIVRHDQYIPEQYLPTFSANPIELNIHKIEGLSEKFIYFNDDMYIMQPLSPSDFFVDDCPCSTAGLSIIGEVAPQFAGILKQDIGVLNRHFSSKLVMKKYLHLFLNPKYGAKRNFQTLLLLPYCTSFFPGFYNAHGPNAFLKTTFAEVWENEPQLLHETCMHKFRDYSDLNQYVMLWWQWCTGKVHPVDGRRYVSFSTALDSNDRILNLVKNSPSKILVFNDSWVEDFEQKKAFIGKAFGAVFPEKSSFEL